MVRMISLLLLLLTACGTQPKSPYVDPVDPKWEECINSIKNICHVGEKRLFSCKIEQINRCNEEQLNR